MDWILVIDLMFDITIRSYRVDECDEFIKNL